jgi:hypothetical protein
MYGHDTPPIYVCMNAALIPTEKEQQRGICLTDMDSQRKKDMINQKGN